MELALNDIQLAVLQWIVDGPDLDNPPSPNFKTSAIALRSRGLIDLDRRRGRWNATVSDKGRFYLENGHHPDASPKKQKPTPIERPERPAAQATVLEHVVDEATPVEKPAAAKPSGVPIPSQIRKPHAAIRELLDYKERVSVPAEVRHRAHLILHALVQESLRRGWKVTPVLSTMRRDSWTGTRTRTWPSADLFSVDAGHAPAGVRLRMKQRHVDHVPTKDEIAHEERYGYKNYRKHDYAPTDKMRLEIGAGAYGSLVLEDTVATRIEDKLLRAVERVQAITDDAIAREEAQKRRAIEEVERQRREAELRNRAVQYGKWATTLGSLHEAFIKHRQLSDLVASLQEIAPTVGGQENYEQFSRYVTWAERHLVESDPLRAIPLPDGDAPDLSLSEWEDWQRRNRPLYGQARPW